MRGECTRLKSSAIIGRAKSALPGRGGGMFCIEVLEIARRTVWAVFRIEWELVHKGHARAAASESDDLDAEELQPLGEAHSKHLDD